MTGTSEIKRYPWEQEFYRMVETTAIETAMETVRKNNKDADYWSAMSLLCQEKARRLRESRV